MLTLENGAKLVKVARKTAEEWFEGKTLGLKKPEEGLKEKRGVFVTIETYPEKNLCGCIGFPSAELPLYEAAQRAAFSSAFEDSRFEPLKKEELDKIIFEVSVMTEPELIRVKHPKQYLERIEAGRDGLILKNGSFTALFLPQVWELIPEKEKFLESLCLKAGLMTNCWQDRNTKVWRFRVQAFKEEKPRGKIFEEKNLK